MHTTTSKPLLMRTAVLPGAVLLLVLTGCASTANTPTDLLEAHTQDPATGIAVTRDIYPLPSDTLPASALRTGRYQLVSLAPTPGERNLLQQVVKIDLPPSMLISVRAGLEHVLRDSGLRLCPPQAQAGFLSMPLPAVHRELGPTTLGAALEVLAGPAWALHVNYAERTVCFERRALAKITGGPAARPPQD